MPSRLLHFLHSLLRREQQHQAHSANCPQPQRRQFVSTLSGDFYVNHYNHVIYSSNNGNVYSTNITTHSADNTSTAITNACGNGNISSRIVHGKETAILLWTMLLIYIQTPSWWWYGVAVDWKPGQSGMPGWGMHWEWCWKQTVASLVFPSMIIIVRYLKIAMLDFRRWVKFGPSCNLAGTAASLEFAATNFRQDVITILIHRVSHWAAAHVVCIICACGRSIFWIQAYFCLTTYGYPLTSCENDVNYVGILDRVQGISVWMFHKWHSSPSTITSLSLYRYWLHPSKS